MRDTGAAPASLAAKPTQVATVTKANSSFAAVLCSGDRCLDHQANDLIFLVMAWIFVVSRLCHAYIHTTSNHVPRA